MGSRHFHVAAAAETLFPAAVPCEIHPDLTFDGLAVTYDGSVDHVYAIVSLHSEHGPDVRAYLGPDHDTAQRHGSLLAAGLMANPHVRLEAYEAADVLAWLTLCWEVAREGLDEATSEVDAQIEHEAQVAALAASLPLKRLTIPG